MTTLSKEDVVRMADNKWCHLGGGKIYEEGGLYVGQFFGDFRQRDRLILAVNSEETLCSRIADLVAENERLTDSNQMYLDRIEYLERKYRCHNEYAKRPILYTDGVDGEQCCRDDLWAVSTAELSAMTDQLTAARTALAAAEARESATRAILDQVMDDIRSEAFLFDGGNGISADTEDAADNLLNQPSDDSALREMIAGVYAECAQACKSFQGKHRAMVFNDELERCVCAIRALAEKAKGE